MVNQDIFDKLQELQEVLLEKIDLEKELIEAPKLLENQEELLTRLKRSFIDKNTELETVMEKATQCKMLLADTELAREKAEANMDNISTQREYELLDKEIRDAIEAEQKYRKDLQQLEKDIEQLEEDQKRDAGLIANQEAELAEKKQEIENNRSEKASEIKTLISKEKAISKGVDEEILFKFERIIRSKLGFGIIPIKNGVCTGCHMILPVEFANQVRAMQTVIFCPYCSRILFYEEAEEELGETFGDDSDHYGALSFSSDEDDEDIEFDEEEDDASEGDGDFDN